MKTRKLQINLEFEKDRLKTLILKQKPLKPRIKHFFAQDQLATKNKY